MSTSAFCKAFGSWPCKYSYRRDTDFVEPVPASGPGLLTISFHWLSLAGDMTAGWCSKAAASFCHKSSTARKAHNYYAKYKPCSVMAADRIAPAFMARALSTLRACSPIGLPRCDAGNGQSCNTSRHQSAVKQLAMKSTHIALL